MKPFQFLRFSAAIIAALGIASAATAQVSYVDAVTADSPIGWWRMTDATDSADDNDGTAGSTTVFGMPGPIVAETNGAAAFDGSADSTILVPDASELNFGSTTDFSIEAWVYRSSGQENTMAICNKGDTNGSFWLRWQDNGSFRFLLDYGSTGANLLTTSTFGIDQWHHVVATADRDDSIKVYVNGAFEGETGLDPVIEAGDISSEYAMMTIGQMDGTHYYNGGLDDFAVYDAALDASQVAAHYQAAQAGGYATAVGADSPIAYFPLGVDGSDSTGNHTSIADSGITFGQSSPITGDTDGAALFDGTEYATVLVDDAPDLNFGEDLDFSIETWFKRDPATEGTTAIAQKGDTNGAFWIRVNSDGKVQFLLDYGATGSSLKTDEAYNDGAWHHLVATADRDDAMRMYVDGAVVGEHFYLGDDISSPGWDLQIGELNGGSQYAGSMDEFALYDTALTLEQIQAHYNAASESGSGGIEGDLNGDGFVGSADLDLVRANWGLSVTGKINGDATGDGVVNSADLDVVRGNWGQGAPVAVPEPSTLLLLAGLILLGATLRRKA